MCEHVLSDEDTSVEAVITRWLHNQDEDDRDVLGGWIKDYFYDALKWVLEQVRPQASEAVVVCRGSDTPTIYVGDIDMYTVFHKKNNPVLNCP